MEKGEIIEQNNRKVKVREIVQRKRSCAATLSDLYPSICLAWVALTGV